MRIVITGATGSIGGALARAYAKDGHSLILQGRKADQLSALSNECTSLGGTVSLASFDLADLEQTRRWCDELLLDGAPDLVFANAGMNINTGADQSGEQWQQMDALLDLNVKSTLLLVHHMALAMKNQGSGQLVIMSSLAAYYGLPVTPTYSASKAALKAYAEGIRGWLAPHNVGVTVVMPGYVSSQMCHEMPGPKPFMWPPEKAARIIKQGVAKNRARISFPFPLNFGCWWLAVLPAAISQRIVKWLDYGG
ncbi:SDR family NAD(P)-dependent oxidoreductase [Neptunomonas qingdaonensis]|uniref:Short-chain dehydrogenase n=1 Tax=Neptunomonas qingdaonensis TaxID=1045558 RepID=A0A1I2PYR3_9GAMM|nr:SDR family NAD(P)-dependent oxidoreductase [Neptunomonas qingdaonensis]SFG19137.1 Short-chain dehydrogenase [Neptunomonas qingdaonensis]